MRIWRILAGLLVLLGLWDVAAAQGPGRRVALVIANSDYANTRSLKNPVNDGVLITAALKKTGFVVIPADPDLGIGPLQHALKTFKDEVPGAEAALVYYAGHGIEARGTNWLIPVDAALKNDSDLDYEAIDVDRVLRATEGAKMRIVILDACRDNPFGRGWSSATRDVQQGLGEIKVDDVLVIYSAAPGQTASDGSGANSPFAEAVARRLPQPGMEIHILGGTIRDDVLRATGGKQRPYISASITGAPFVFVQGNVTVNVTLPPVAAAPAFDPRSLDLAYWTSVGASNDVGQLNAYLHEYPHGAFVEAAKAKIAALSLSTAGHRAPAKYVAGRIFKDCADVCPPMVNIAPGKFLMGSPASQVGRIASEGPVHQVTIGYGFAVSEYPITFAEWDACAAENGCGGLRPADLDWGRDRRPVISVTWNDAQAYVRWLSGRTGQTYRLLTESEYEYVNRASSQTSYWWGNAPGPGHAVCDGCGSRWDKRQTAPVGSFPPNAFGLYDTTGNVWSWTQDCSTTSYSNAPTDGSADLSGDCSSRALRGGAWNSDPRFLRSANRNWTSADGRHNDLGFRVARTF